MQLDALHLSPRKRLCNAGPALLATNFSSDLESVQCCGGLGSAVGAGASKHLLPAKCVNAVGISACWGEILPPIPKLLGVVPAAAVVVGLLRCLRAEPPADPPPTKTPPAAGEKPPPKMVAGD